MMADENRYPQALFEAEQASLNHVFGEGSRKDRLLRFYHRYNREKLQDIEKFLEAYSDESDPRLFGDLALKYSQKVQHDFTILFETWETSLLEENNGRHHELQVYSTDKSDEDEEDWEDEEQDEESFDTQPLPACQLLENALAIDVKVPPCRNLDETFAAIALNEEASLPWVERRL